MDRQQMEYLCRYRSILSGIPIRLYENEKLVYKQEPMLLKEDICQNVYPMLSNSEKSIAYIVLNNRSLFGLIKVADSPYDIVVGPSKSADFTEEEQESALFSLGFEYLDKETFEKYFAVIPIVPINYFFLMLSEINLYVNNEIVHIYDFINMNSQTVYENMCETHENLMESFEKLDYNEAPKHSVQAFEEQMFFYIKNGQTEKLNHLFKNSILGNTGKLANSQLRQDKNNAIVSITIATRAAISGNLNPEMAYQLSDYYIQKIEEGSDSSQILQTNATAMIDFCSRVKELHYNGLGSPVIDRAVRYIADHITQKITVDDMAKNLYISRAHLSSKFKNETGMNLIDYIALQKINEAKRLLRYTDKSLSEISTYLAYSSQSYFQNQFKKITGITPLLYRERKSENSLTD